MTDALTTNTQVRSRWLVRVGVYVMLVLSAAAVFFLNDRLWEAARLGSLPLWAPLLPVVTFTAFTIVYSIDRWLLVKKRHYPAVRAFFQVACAIVFLSLLWPSQAQKLGEATVSRTSINPTDKLLGYRDPDVRAAACELVGLRTQTDLRSRVERMAQDDKSPHVRAACNDAAKRLNAVRVGD